MHRVPRRYPRWLLKLVAAVEWFCAAILRGKALYRRHLRRGRLAVTIVDVPLRGLPRAFDGLRLLHLSDFHAGPFLDSQSLKDVVAIANELAPDVLCLTGDYITHSIDEAMTLLPALAAIRAPRGAFAVFGNHDYRARREAEFATQLETLGIRTLRNAGVTIEKDGERLWFAGIEDVEEGKHVDLGAALEGRAGALTILLAHHPDVVDQIATRNIALVLSGHTHGGQINIAGRPIFGGSLRSKYPPGLTRVEDRAVFVTKGVGVLMLPWRRKAPAEVALLELRRRE